MPALLRTFGHSLQGGETAADPQCRHSAARGPEPVPGKGTQTIDKGNDPAEDEKVAASHGHTTVTGVPTGTCS